jgi:hypothetical protein
LLAYLFPLDVDVTGNNTAKLCEVWSEFNIFYTLITIATATILNFFNPLQLTWKQKRGEINRIWIPFIKLHETL